MYRNYLNVPQLPQYTGHYLLLHTILHHFREFKPHFLFMLSCWTAVWHMSRVIRNSIKTAVESQTVPLPDAADFDADAADFRWRDAAAAVFRRRDAYAVANFDADAVTLPTFIVDTVTDDTVTDDTVTDDTIVTIDVIVVSDTIVSARTTL